jgi:hypothetical protein
VLAQAAQFATEVWPSGRTWDLIGLSQKIGHHTNSFNELLLETRDFVSNKSVEDIRGLAKQLTVLVNRGACRNWEQRGSRSDTSNFFLIKAYDCLMYRNSRFVRCSRVGRDQRQFMRSSKSNHMDVTNTTGRSFVRVIVPMSKP